MYQSAKKEVPHDIPELLTRIVYRITFTANEATENEAKHTFKLLVGCYLSGFAMDLLLVKTINVSID